MREWDAGKETPQDNAPGERAQRARRAQASLCINHVPETGLQP